MSPGAWRQHVCSPSNAVISYGNIHRQIILSLKICLNVKSFLPFACRKFMEKGYECG